MLSYKAWSVSLLALLVAACAADDGSSNEGNDSVVAKENAPPASTSGSTDAKTGDVTPPTDTTAPPTTNEPPKPKAPFTNPVVATSCPDPGVLARRGSSNETTFYMTCTGGKFGIKQSTDLVNWTATGSSILSDGKASWSLNGSKNWAPEIHEIGGQFVAYFTAINASSTLSIGVAKAAAPTGPFVDTGKPLVENALGAIDATEFTDDDGSKWLVYKLDGNAQQKPTPILIRKLSDDGLGFAPGSAAKQILVNDPATWEGGVVEAPWVVKRDGTYFLLYSGNVYDQRYRTGVARATSLTGTWEKHGAPILANNDAWVGPGHGSVVEVPTSDGKTTQDYFVYHAWHNAGGGAADRDKGRVVLLDRITWVNGWPQIGKGTPTVGSQPAPGAP